MRIIAKTDEHPDYYLSQAENEQDEPEEVEEEDIDPRHDYDCQCPECLADEQRARSAEALANMLMGESDEGRKAA